MIPLFLGLSLVNLLSLCVAAWLGYTHHRSVHVLAGALATLVCCAVHCVVFTYFIATAKWVQHAVLVKRLDPALVLPTRSFKLQAFPAALLAMASVFLAAVLGAARDNEMVRPTWHWIPALLAIGVNVVVVFIEYRAIARNGRLIDQILANVATIDAPTRADEHSSSSSTQSPPS
jgi:hypothetical protein